ncbi:MAG: LPS assembly protein LptD [Campylobacterales bacterium]
MWRKGVAFLLLSPLLYAGEMITILSGSERYEDGLIYAEEDPLVSYGDYLLKADTIIYDRNNSLIEARGHVALWQAGAMAMLGDELLIDLNRSQMRWRPFFYYDESGRMWSRANEGNSSNGRYYLKGAITSSCSPTNPDWSLRFSSGYYDKNQSYVLLYNARLSVGDWPIFYLPIFAFPTSKERRSGLLPPKFGYSPGEGFIWMQPWYLAIHPQWDLQFDPQVRSQRGYGVNTTLRFVDSPWSYGEIRSVWFRDRPAYVAEVNKNSVVQQGTLHYGAELTYRRTHLLASKGDHDGVWLDLKKISDVDYINLYQLGLPSVISSQVVSRANYYIQVGEHYGGIYGRYFEDLAKSSNNDTIQYLPQLHYHKNISSITESWLSLLTSVDYKFKNYTRQEGEGAYQHELLLPLQWHKALANDYLHLALSETIYVNSVESTGYPSANRNYRLISSYHQIRLFSDMMRSYAKTTHALSLLAVYTKPGMDVVRGELTTDADLSSLLLSKYEREHIVLTAKNFFYTPEGRIFLAYGISQRWEDANETGTFHSRPIEHDIRWYPTKSIEIMSELSHDHSRGALSQARSTISVLFDRWDGRLGHIYKDEVGTIRTNYLSLSAGYKIDSRYRLSAQYEYDVEAHRVRVEGVMLSLRKGCWNYDLSLRKENYPGSTVANTMLLLRLELIPLGQMQQRLSLSGGSR